MSTLTTVAVLALLMIPSRMVLAGSAASIFLRSFESPMPFTNGIASDLVGPIGSTSKFTFESGKVAIGDLPVPMPERSGARRRSRGGARFVLPSASGPRARVLLNGVTDADGNLVNNTGDQLVIDALVSPGSAALSPPPFVFSFDINGGVASVDVTLPIVARSDDPVRLQVIGVSVLDPDGQVFATLGFELRAARATPVASVTPAATATPEPEGRCFTGSSCGGTSFPAGREECCPRRGFENFTSWCPGDALDATGQCDAGACQPCGGAPRDCGTAAICDGPCVVRCSDGSVQHGSCEADDTCHCSATCSSLPTPLPGPCAGLASCGGACSLTCADGTVVAGQCASDANAACQCTAVCAAPTPCGVGECFDTITMSCTGQPCDAKLHCPLPNQICDVAGRHCPCQPPPPPLPHGHICCRCSERTPSCFDFSYVEVQPICPPGCDTFLGQECNATNDACVALTPCTSDQDCDDGNACTVDRCTRSGCTHDCVCVNADGCGPGPGRRPH